MSKPAFLRLQRIFVDGLFGTYNHDINLDLHDRVTLLHGPNGVGKTVILEMVRALLGERLDYFRPIPFSRFSLSFQDGSTVELTVRDDTSGDERPYVLTLIRNGARESTTLDHPLGASFIAKRFEYLRPHPSIANTWIDMRDGEILPSSEVVSRYADYLSLHDDHDYRYPDWFTSFLKNANVHFIEAQRLVRMDSDPSPGHRFSPSPHAHPRMVSTVVEFSRDFSRRLAKTMAQYGRTSQMLDQSFPQRLMEPEHNPETQYLEPEHSLEAQHLQERMLKLDKMTSDYKNMGILDKTPTHPFSVSSLGTIDNTQLRVMTLYVQDTEKKLKALEDLATRTRLLLENVNQKYRHKSIELDRDRGLVAKSASGQTVALTSLSSGEQQELVLQYDLLFRVPSNTIVLIDEPELSLHVAWQKKFLPDLLKAVQLSDFDAVVATHSPFVVGERTDLMIGLGDAV